MILVAKPPSSGTEEKFNAGDPHSLRKCRTPENFGHRILYYVRSPHFITPTMSTFNIVSHTISVTENVYDATTETDRSRADTMWIMTIDDIDWLRRFFLELYREEDSAYFVDWLERGPDITLTPAKREQV